MRHACPADVGEEHVIEFQIIGVYGITGDLFDGIRAYLAMTDYVLGIDRIRDMRRQDRLASS